MLRRSHILTTAALLAVCATPASAATYEDLQSDGAAGAQLLRPRPRSRPRPPTSTRTCARPTPWTRPSTAAYTGRPRSYALNRDYGSPARRRRRDLPSVPAGACKARPLHRTRAQAGRVAECRRWCAAPSARYARHPVVAVHEPSGELRLGRRGHRRGRNARAVQHRRRIGADADRAQAPPRRQGRDALTHATCLMYEGGARCAAPLMVRSVMDSAP